MVYVIQVCWQLFVSKLSANLYDIYHCCVYSKKLLMMDRGTVPKHVEVYSKNKFEKLVYLVGFIIRIYILLFIEYNGDVTPEKIKCYWMLPIHASQLVSDKKEDFIHDLQSLMPCFWLNTIIHSRILVRFASKRYCNLWRWSEQRSSWCEILHTCVCAALV